MNAPRKKSAIAKYTGMPIDEVPAALAADEKGYTADEQAEILAALQEPGEQTNTATTDIIPDTLVSQPSGRKNAKIADGGQVNLYNNQTKQTHPMTAEGAYRLVRQNPDKYQIID